jgi:anaerobic ribonucleoside-triphosphate reductase
LNSTKEKEMENETENSWDDMPNCSVCNGKGIPLGVLGKLSWFRCRNCGWEFSVKCPDLPPEN